MDTKYKFIVIEGLDGAGKSTQIKFLKKFLDSHNIQNLDIHFPKLNMGYYGKLVAEFLRGEFGSIDLVDPKIVALLFAGDRKEHINEIEDELGAGKAVIADRYVNSNIAFQCAKCKDIQRKENLKEWILDFEFNYNKLPEPSCSFFLDVPLEAVKASLSKNRSGEDREYLNGKQDIHEADFSFQEKVRNEYLQMVAEQDNFYKIDCYDKDGVFFDPQTIHQKIIERIESLGIL